MSDLDAKLVRWDAHAEDALRWVIGFMLERPDEILALARGRHVLGHYLHGDRNYMEYDADRLLAEMLEECADAVNYIARRQYLLNQER